MGIWVMLGQCMKFVWHGLTSKLTSHLEFEKLDLLSLRIKSIECPLFKTTQEPCFDYVRAMFTLLYFQASHSYDIPKTEYNWSKNHIHRTTVNQTMSGLYLN